MGALTYKGVLSCRGDPGLSLIIAARRGTVEGETVVRWGGQASSAQGMYVLMAHSIHPGKNAAVLHPRE